jgi:hypothetical protein
MRHFIKIVEGANNDLIDKASVALFQQIQNEGPGAYENQFTNESNMEPDEDGFEDAFDEWLKEHCWDEVNNYYYEIHSQVENGAIECYRMITAPKTWKIDQQHPGLFWSWDLDAADAHWGKFNKGDVRWLITAQIPELSIDWIKTLVQNGHESYKDEKEVRIFDSAAVNVISTKIIN